MRERIKSEFGLTVNVVDDDGSSVRQADGVDLVIISGSTSSSQVLGKFKGVSVPVIVQKPTILDDMGMAEGVWNVGHGSFNGTDVEVIAPSHPIMAGIAGNVTLFTQSEAIPWGVPAGSADVLALDSPATPNNVVFFVYEPGDVLVDGSPTAGCRIMPPWLRTGPHYFTVDGETIFDNTIAWALDGCVGVPTGVSGIAGRAGMDSGINLVWAFVALAVVSGVILSAKGANASTELSTSDAKKKRFGRGFHG